MEQNYIPDNVTQFPDKAELVVRQRIETLGRFESLATHFSISPATDHDTRRYAHQLLQYAGINSDKLDESELKENAQRLSAIRFSTGVSDTMYDNLVDPDHDDYDEAFAYIVDQMKATRDDAGRLEDERRALSVLLDLRVGAINVGIERHEQWKKIAKLLVGNFSDDE